jgi:uncharacterized protein
MKRTLISILPFTLVALVGSSSVDAAPPSFDCAKAEGAAQQLVCKDEGLASLDRELSRLYRLAVSGKHMTPARLDELKATQRGWIKGRDDCWKAEDKPLCVSDSYRQRIAELQARYALLPATGPVFYSCDGIAAKEVVATFYPTDPASVVVEFGDSTSLMLQQVAASGSRYQGRNESFWEHQGKAVVVWGYQAPEMQCEPRAERNKQ